MKKVLLSSIGLSIILACEQQPLTPNIITDDVKNDVYAHTVSNFVKYYGEPEEDEYAEALVRTTDGGYAFLGSTHSDNWDFYLVRTDANGNMKWGKKYGQTGMEDRGKSLRQTPDGGFILIGTEQNLFDYRRKNVKVIKTDGNGNIQWQTNYGSIERGPLNGYGNDITLSNDNGYVGIGNIGNSSAIASSDSTTRATVFKLDANGNLLWVKNYGGKSVTNGNSIERTSDNGFIASGKILSKPGLDDNETEVYLFKTSANGDFKWQKTSWGGQYADAGYHAIQTSDGGYAVVGVDSKAFGFVKSTIYLIKVNSQGEYQWIKGYLPSWNIRGKKIRQLSDRSYVIVANGGDAAAPTLLKVSSNGSYQWHKTFDYSILSYGTDLVIASDGGYVISGFIQDNEGYSDAALIKTDKNGNFELAELSGK